MGNSMTTEDKVKAGLGCLGLIIVVAIVLYGVVTFLLGTQYFTKTLGGTTTIDLPQGKKLVPYTVQWENKGSNIWYLTEDAEYGYTPKTYTFHESSNLGTLEGTIEFVEH